MRQKVSFRRAGVLAFAAAVGLASACGASKHADDDEAGASGGSSAEGGLGAESGGSAGLTGGSGGKAGGASAGRAGASSSAGGRAGSSSVTGGSSGSGGESGGDGASGGDTSTGGVAGSASGRGGTGGAAGTGPRAPFSPKLACDAPRWLTTVPQPLEATDPLAVTNGLGVFMVTYLTSEEVNATETWGNTVVSMERDGLYPNPLENTVGQGTNTHVGQLAMGATGDAIWLQNPGVLGASDMSTLRRWDQAAGAWDDPHVVPGLRGFGVRATFLDAHDILVVGTIDDEVVSVVYDSMTQAWSTPEPLGSLGSALPNWASTHVAVAADGAGNAAAVWSNEKASGARVMRARAWVGAAVPLSADALIEGFWDVGVVPAGAGEFELVAGPQDQTRGVMMQAFRLGYEASTGTVLGTPEDAGTLPMVTYVGAGQPITVARDLDGDLTVASAFWTDRPEFWVFRRTGGVWAEPALLASGTIVANNNIGMGLHSLALDSGGHGLAVTANIDDELVLREIEKGSSTWTEGVRIDTADFRFNRRGVSLVLDGDEPVIFWSADGNGWSNVAWTACR